MIHFAMRSLLVRSIFLFVSAGLLFSCRGEETANQIHGQWQAFAAEEEGRALQVRLEEIRFEFDEKGDYRFFSTLNHREAGQYELQNGLLYTLDTLHQGAPTKRVKITRLEADTLVLSMQEEGKERVLSLQRTQ